MTLDNVRRLRKRFENEPDFRRKLNLAQGKAGREAILAEEGLSFSDDEFEEMLNVMHVECQTQEEAEDFFAFRDWWRFLRTS